MMVGKWEIIRFTKALIIRVIILVGIGCTVNNEDIGPGLLHGGFDYI